MRRAWGIAAVLFASACAKGSAADGAPGSAGPPGAESAAPPPKSPSPTASVTGVTGPTGWKGSYKSVAGTIVLPKDVKWKVPETAAGVGEGTITLTVDRSTRRVRGKVDGVLGPAIVDGVALDGKIMATVAREDPADQGFTGTLSGEVADAGTSGTMNVALADVSAVRNATFELAPVP
jgi:hypothetical protein